MDAKRLVIVDWGYSATLCLLSYGQLPLTDISFALLSPAANAENMRPLIADRQNLFVDHATGFEVFPGVHERLASIAQRNGYSRQVVQTIFDRNYRPRFEVVKLPPRAGHSMTLVFCSDLGRPGKESPFALPINATGFLPSWGRIVSLRSIGPNTFLVFRPPTARVRSRPTHPSLATKFPRSGPGYSVPAHQHLISPIRPMDDEILRYGGAC